MRGKKDDRVWEEFDKINDVRRKMIAKCKHCVTEFKGKPSTKRLRNHLLGVPDRGIRICTKVPGHVKNALSNSYNRPSSNDVVASSVSPFGSQHNNELENHGDIRDGMPTTLQHMQQPWTDEHASEQMDELAEFDLNRYLANNLSSICALQQHSEFQDSVQDGERMQADQEDFVVPETNGLLENLYAEPDPSFDEVNNSFSTSAPQQQTEFQNRVRDGERMQANQECFEGGGFRSCTLVPNHVQNALANASTSSKRPRIEPPSSINNNEFNNQGGNEQHTSSGIRICTQVPDHVKNALSNSNNRPQIEHHNSSNNVGASSVSPSATQQSNELENHGDIQGGMQTALQHLQQQASDEHAHEQMAESAGFDDPSSYFAGNLSSTCAWQLENHGDNGDQMQAVLQFIEQQESDKRAHQQMTDSFNQILQHLLDDSPSTSAPQLQCEIQNRVHDGERMQVDQEGFVFLGTNGSLEINGGDKHNDELENHGDIGDEMQADLQQRGQQPHEFSDKRALEQMDATLLSEPDPSCEEVNNSFSTSAPQQQSEFQNRVPDGERMQANQECFEGGGFRSCTLMPDHVQNALADASTSSKRPRIEPNESENQMQADQEVVRGTDQECCAMPESSRDGEPFLTEKFVGAAFQKNMDTVLEWLMSDKVSSIGVFGMGGVGKTTLLMHIYNRIQEDRSRFGGVCWVTVSQDVSCKRLQNHIARSIGLDFRNEKDFKKRAAKLSKELKRKCNFVLILDDLWDHFDVKKMGIPIEVNGCKLIVTTRSLEVCRRINCQEELKVEPLWRNEAWKLFLETLGHDLASRVEQIARSMVGECAGLPLGIVTMAGSMRRAYDIHVWENALTELQKSKVRAGDMKHEVFKILRFSYARLRESQLQECLLYCALYPEDFRIAKKELIEQLIDEGIIERMDSRQEAFNKGYAMLKTLENSCLLECSYGDGVKMHDLIRDMAIQIMKECSPSLVEAGRQLTCLPKKKWWTENIVRVSLMDNDIREISSHYSPRCPNLSTLILSKNKSMQSIAEPFFYHLHGLKVLNLSSTNIEKLPESVGDLEKLTALILRYCECLRSLPSLRKLEVLEKLDLYGCEEFEDVPEGLESLFNLNYLDLLETRVKDLPAGILTNLSHLQFLRICGSSQDVKGEEVGRLRNLETLFWRFNDQEDFNNYIHSLSNMHMEKQQLSEFVLVVGPGSYDFEETLSFIDCGQHDLYFTECNMSREVLLPKDVQRLDIVDVTIHNGKSLCLKNVINLNVINLKEFIIEGCKEMEYLFCLSSSLSIFQTLETLWCDNMENLRGLLVKTEMMV